MDKGNLASVAQLVAGTYSFLQWNGLGCTCLERTGVIMAKNIRKTFETLLAQFVKSTSDSMEAARELANITISQFDEHGDLSFAQSFVDAMPGNYIRRVAYLSWLADYSPLIVEGGAKDGYKLSKDKSPEANEFNVAVATAISFWEYKPEPEQIHFGQNDVVKALKAAVRKFGKDRYHASSDQATLAVSAAKDMITELEVQLKHDNSNVDPDKAMDEIEDQLEIAEAALDDVERLEATG